MTAITSLLPEQVKRNAVYRSLRAAYLFRQTEGYKRLRQSWLRNDRAKIRRYLETTAEPKLHLGCGGNPRPGWLNTDFLPDARDLCHLDATAPFPLPGGAFDLVYSEHMIEHLPLEGGLNMLAESFRVLKSGGRVRIATPSMEALIAIYERPDEPLHAAYLDWHRTTWMQDCPLPTPAMLFNDFYRNWGHLCVYDEGTLVTALTRSGFVEVTRRDVGESDFPALRGLENDRRMPPGLLALHTLTLEARKP